jgi:hypothetical protein
MQVFMKPRGNGVLDGSFYSVGRHSRAQTLPKASRASSIIPGAAAQLSHPCAHSHTAHRSFTEGLLFPVLAVRVRGPRLRHSGMDGCQRNSDEDQLGDAAHTGITAISLPLNIHV